MAAPALECWVGLNTKSPVLTEAPILSLADSISAAMPKRCALYPALRIQLEGQPEGKREVSSTYPYVRPGDAYGSPQTHTTSFGLWGEKAGSFEMERIGSGKNHCYKIQPFHSLPVPSSAPFLPITTPVLQLPSPPCPPSPVIYWVQWVLQGLAAKLWCCCLLLRMAANRELGMPLAAILQ